MRLSEDQADERERTEVAPPSRSLVRAMRIHARLVGVIAILVGRKKSELLEEAAKRFAKDPKTLEKVRQYIESHAPKG